MTYVRCKYKCVRVYNERSLDFKILNNNNKAEDYESTSSIFTLATDTTSSDSSFTSTEDFVQLALEANDYAPTKVGKRIRKKWTKKTKIIIINKTKLFCDSFIFFNIHYRGPFSIQPID